MLFTPIFPAFIAILAHPPHPNPLPRLEREWRWELFSCVMTVFSLIRAFLGGLALKPEGVFCIQLKPRKREIALQVSVRDNNIDQALRALKKKLQREGVFREMKIRRNYEKPSERKARERSEAIRRQRKVDRKKREREGF